MKNRIIVGVAVFYLLLSTGMFACFVSCGSQALVKLFTFIPSQERQHHNQNRNCSALQDCYCCDKHGNYVVTENIKPDIDASAPQVLWAGYVKATYFAEIPIYLLPENPLRQTTHPPPAESAIPIFIQFRSLLI